MLLLLIGIVNVSAITSNEVTYENEGISETLTNTIDTLYQELKEYRTNGTVTSNEMLEGYTGYAKGKLISGNIPSKGSTTYTPGVNNQVINKGRYLSEDQVILGDANLVSENIKEGVEIFGIKGGIKDNSGKTLEATYITNDENYTYLNIPEGLYNSESKVKFSTKDLEESKQYTISVSAYGSSSGSTGYGTTQFLLDTKNISNIIVDNIIFSGQTPYSHSCYICDTRVSAGTIVDVSQKKSCTIELNLDNGTTNPSKMTLIYTVK